MHIILKLLLAFGVGLVCVAIINAPDIIRKIKEEGERDKSNGCHCPTRFWFSQEISPECPVHGKYCTISEHMAWNGHKYVIYPTTSVERVPVCRDCLKSTVQEDFSLFYHTKVVGMENDKDWPKGCVVCEESALCAMVPKNLVDNWLEGNVFHFSQGRKKVKDASRRGKDIEPSISSEELD